MDEIDPRHQQTRSLLRRVGVSLMVVGGVLVAIGMASFFAAFGEGGPPRYFWCAFVGMPIGFVGLVLTSYGFMGSILRYSAGQMAPVGKDTFNYMAQGTKDGIQNVASAIGEGLRAGSPAPSGGVQVRCHKCNHANTPESKFCSQCGVSLGKTQPCPACNELNDPDAKFCDNCGRATNTPGT
ncbi:MAG: zinc ribbon domain-containing protein [Phycisphaerales bacterium]